MVKAVEEDGDPFVRERVERLDAALQLARSLDGMLVMLESELVVIREEAERRGVLEGALLEKVLSSPRLRPYLSRIKCCEDEMLRLTDSPRFRGLRRNRDVLLRLLEGIECAGGDLVDCGVPEPAWVKEKYPAGRDAKPVPVRVARSPRLRPGPVVLRRGDVLAYGFMALLAILTLAILLFK